MSPRERYEAGVALLRARGEVEERDWCVPGRTPYRHAILDVAVPTRAATAAACGALAELAVAAEAGLSLYLYDHRDGATISLTLSRDLDADEAVGLSGSRAVAHA